MRFLTKMVNSILSPTRLCQTQYDSKDQESKVHTLSRVDDDAHPGAAEAPAWKCVQEDTTNDRPWDAPGLVKVIEAKEHPVCYPAPPAKYALHPEQQHTPKEKLLSQKRIEDSVHHKHRKEPPGAQQPVQHFLRFQNRAQAISRRLGEKGGERDPQAIDVRCQRKFPHDNPDQKRDHPQPESLRRVSPVFGSRGVLSRNLRLTVAQRRSPSSRRTMIMERTNNQIKPVKSSTNRVTPAPSGSELKSGDTAGNMIQLRIPIGTAARAQMPRILPSEYCSPISDAAFARAVVSILPPASK